MDREVRFETSYLGRLSAGSVRSHARAPRRWSPMRFFPICFLALPFLLVGGGCKRSAPTSLVAHGDTFAEMRTIKGEIGVNAPGESKRAPYPRERLAEGSEVTLAAQPAPGPAPIARPPASASRSATTARRSAPRPSPGTTGPAASPPPTPSHSPRRSGLAPSARGPRATRASPASRSSSSGSTCGSPSITTSRSPRSIRRS